MVTTPVPPMPVTAKPPGAGASLVERRQSLVAIFENHRGRASRRDDVAALAVRPVAKQGVNA